MLSEAVKRELERLCRRALQRQAPRGTTKAPREYDTAPSCSGDAPVRLEEIADGREVVNPAGKFLLIDRSASQLPQSSDRFMSIYSFRFEKETAAISGKTAPAESVSYVGSRARKCVFLDIETTGLCGSPLFLVGLLFQGENGLLIRQLFARNYSEEKPLLQHLTDLFEEFDVVATFNGKSFDIPYIRDRCSYNMLSFSLDCDHVDLLHECRRQWKQVLPDCRLQTLESRICYRYREGDIPSSEIPRAYHDYVRTGDARLMKNVLYHNAFDLFTMNDLAWRLFSQED